MVAFFCLEKATFMFAQKLGQKYFLSEETAKIQCEGIVKI